MTLPSDKPAPSSVIGITPSATKRLSVHVVTGFLGAGKTTVISRWLAEKPSHERWAIVVNEFGQIGIDHAAWAGSGVMIQEVAGGCICCLQNMPLQLALGAITSRGDIDRLIIEPTGLGHPTQIIETLQAPHWQPYLALAATVCVLDARMLSDARARTHETFMAQVAVADALLFSKADILTAGERAAAEAYASGLAEPKALVAFVGPERSGIEALAVAPRPPRQQRRSLLHQPVVKLSAVASESAAQARAQAAAQAAAQEKIPPYHYHEAAQGHVIGGWILPADWVFRHDDLLTELMRWRDAERVKGVFHTDKGWVFFNATTVDLAVRSSEYRSDNRVEVISAADIDWAAREQCLLACLAEASTAQPARDQEQQAQQ